MRVYKTLTWQQVTLSIISALIIVLLFYKRNIKHFPFYIAWSKGWFTHMMQVQTSISARKSMCELGRHKHKRKKKENISFSYACACIAPVHTYFFLRLCLPACFVHVNQPLINTWEVGRTLCYASWFPYATLMFSQLPACLDQAI